LELSLAAADLLTWAQALCFDGALARCEPAAFRYRVGHVAARLVRTGRSWTSMFLSAVHDRLLPTGLAELNTPTPTPTPLRSAAHAYQTAIDDLARSAGLAA
jgi:hypothetical protein